MKLAGSSAPGIPASADAGSLSGGAAVSLLFSLVAGSVAAVSPGGSGVVEAAVATLGSAGGVVGWLSGASAGAFASGSGSISRGDPSALKRRRSVTLKFDSSSLI